MLDPLEQRVLLNADVLALDLATVYADQRDSDLLVRLHQENLDLTDGSATVQRVQIIDRQGGAVLAFGDLADISAVSIVGGTGNDQVTFDALSFGETAPFSFSMAGGEGIDRLTFGTQRSTFWTVNDLNAGFAHDNAVTLSFDGVEWLTGSDGNEDTFVITESGSLSGGLDGGALGFDTMIFDGGSFDTVTYRATDATSGFYERDADSLFFTGLEPIYDNLDVNHRIIDISPESDSDTGPTTAILRVGTGFDFEIVSATTPDVSFESALFSAPNESLTITSDRNAAKVAGVLDRYVTLDIDGLSTNFTGDLIVETEVINVNADLGSVGDRLSSVTLRASDSGASNGLWGNLSGVTTATTAVTVNANVYATGNVEFSATASRSPTTLQDFAGDVLQGVLPDAFFDSGYFDGLAAVEGVVGVLPPTQSPLQIPTLSASTIVRNGVTIDITTGNLTVSAATQLDVNVTGENSLFGSQLTFAENDTRAEIEDGVTVSVGGLVEIAATDTTNIDITLDFDDSTLMTLPEDFGTDTKQASGFGIAASILTLDRDTQALVGSGTVTSAGLTVTAVNAGAVVN
ncbi:MAG: hypothetical protein ACJA1F_002141, partial [Paracoccaceae bacterium]